MPQALLTEGYLQPFMKHAQPTVLDMYGLSLTIPRGVTFRLDDPNRGLYVPQSVSTLHAQALVVLFKCAMTVLCTWDRQGHSACRVYNKLSL